MGRGEVIFMNKEKIQQSFLSVIRVFPELKDTEIRIEFHTKNQCMFAQPIFSSLLSPAINRKYRILIPKKEPFTTFLNSLDDEIIDGWLAHELSHILSYKKMSNGKLVLFGIKYILSKKFLRQVEKETNEEAYKRGFSKGLSRGGDAIISSTILPKSYGEFIKRNYRDR